VLQKIEAVVFFLAMLLAVLLEGGIVYWLWEQPAGLTPFGLTGQWSGATLPQAWSLGALLVLAYRLMAMFMPSLNHANEDGRRSRKAFLRLWCWTMALIAMQGLAFFVERTAGS
jgi:hypothetical protein